MASAVRRTCPSQRNVLPAPGLDRLAKTLDARVHLPQGLRPAQQVGVENPAGHGVETKPPVWFANRMSSGSWLWRMGVTGICNMWIQTYWLAQELIDSDSHTCVLKQIGESSQ